MYHSSAFARERDKIRQAVLENRGWKIFRVWSSDWWTNKEGAVKKLDAALREFLEESRQKEAQQEPPRKETVPKDSGSNGSEQAEPIEGDDKPPFENDSKVPESEPDVDKEQPRDFLAPYPSFEGSSRSGSTKPPTFFKYQMGCVELLSKRGPSSPSVRTMFIFEDAEFAEWEVSSRK